jgi:hypothetical protein
MSSTYENASALTYAAWSAASIADRAAYERAIAASAAVDAARAALSLAIAEADAADAASALTFAARQAALTAWDSATIAALDYTTATTRSFAA